MSLRRNTRKSRDRERPDTRDLLVTLEQLLRRQIPVTTQRQLRYEDAIGWFIDQRPPGGAASRGAIVRTRRRDGRIDVVQVFLDSDAQLVASEHGVPYGRRLVVESLDDELAEAFGEASMLVVD